MTDEEKVRDARKDAKLAEIQFTTRTAYGVFDGAGKMLSFGWWTTTERAWKSAREELKL